MLKYQESYYRWNPQAEMQAFGGSLDLSQPAAAVSKNGSEFLCIKLLGAKKGQKKLEPVEE